MVRAEKYIRFSQVTEGFLGASLQFEKGIEKTVMWYLFSKITPSLFTLKEGSTFLTKPLFPQGREDVTALRCSEPLRSKVGGASKPSPDCAGWDRLGKTGGRWLFLTHSNMFGLYICGFVIRSFHFGGIRSCTLADMA